MSASKTGSPGRRPGVFVFPRHRAAPAGRAWRRIRAARPDPARPRDGGSGGYGVATGRGASHAVGSGTTQSVFSAFVPGGFGSGTLWLTGGRLFR